MRKSSCNEDIRGSSLVLDAHGMPRSV